MSNEARNERILALCGQKSFGLIAAELGLTRNIVAGVVWRARWPVEQRCRSKGCKGRNMIGTGHHGCGPYAAETLGWDAQ